MVSKFPIALLTFLVKAGESYGITGDYSKGVGLHSVNQWKICWSEMLSIHEGQRICWSLEMQHGVLFWFREGGRRPKLLIVYAWVEFYLVTFARLDILSLYWSNNEGCFSQYLCLRDIATTLLLPLRNTLQLKGRDNFRSPLDESTFDKLAMSTQSCILDHDGRGVSRSDFSWKQIGL